MRWEGKGVSHAQSCREKGWGKLSPRWGRGGSFSVKFGEVGGGPVAELKQEVTGEGEDPTA
jgi:hypothetical protein